MDLSVLNPQNLDLSVLNPIVDLHTETTSNLAASLHPHQILWTLYSIPQDLIGFYENFARGVRRGFNDIVSKVSQGGTRLYKDISSIVPAKVPSYKPGQKKVSTDKDTTNERKDTKKTNKDDPSSPYSVNYDGEFKPNSGYSLTLKDEDGKKTGFYKYSSPQHSVSLSWPRQDQGQYKDKQGTLSTVGLLQEMTGLLSTIILVMTVRM